MTSAVLSPEEILARIRGMTVAEMREAQRLSIERKMAAFREEWPNVVEMPPSLMDYSAPDSDPDEVIISTGEDDYYTKDDKEEGCPKSPSAWNYEYIGDRLFFGFLKHTDAVMFKLHWHV